MTSDLTWARCSPSATTVWSVAGPGDTRVRERQLTAKPLTARWRRCDRDAIWRLWPFPDSRGHAPPHTHRRETPSQVQISVDFSASRRSRSSSICVYDTPRVPSPRDPRTVAGVRQHRRPRSVPTTKRRRMTCVRGRLPFVYKKR